MAPEEQDTQTTRNGDLLSDDDEQVVGHDELPSSSSGLQYLYIIRHGDRWDYVSLTCSRRQQSR